MGMTAHNLRRRKLAEAEAQRRAASLKAAPSRNLAAELEVERQKTAQLSQELAAEKAAKAALEDELTAPDPAPVRTGEPTPTIPDPKPQRPQGRGRG